MLLYGRNVIYFIAFVEIKLLSAYLGTVCPFKKSNYSGTITPQREKTRSYISEYDTTNESFSFFSSFLKIPEPFKVRGSSGIQYSFSERNRVFPPVVKVFLSFKKGNTEFRRCFAIAQRTLFLAPQCRHSDQKTVEFLEFHGLFLTFGSYFRCLFQIHQPLIYHSTCCPDTPGQRRYGPAPPDISLS